MSISKKVGERLRKRREQLGKSGTWVAVRAGVDQSFLSRVERGEANFSAENLEKVAGVLAISLESLYANEDNIVAASPDVRRIPVLDFVQAGDWREVLENPEDMETIGVSLECPPSSFAMRIRGNSMEPDFKEGDIVVIAPPVVPLPGDYVVATDHSGMATFKKYRALGLNARKQEVFELVALNPDYGTMRSDIEGISIVGTMIEHRRFRRVRI